MFRVGDIVVWSKRYSYKISLQVCRIQKINQHTYSVTVPTALPNGIVNLKRCIMKENILRLASEHESRQFTNQI